LIYGGRRLNLWVNPILLLDATGLSLFSVNGPLKRWSSAAVRRPLAAAFRLGHHTAALESPSIGNICAAVRSGQEPHEWGYVIRVHELLH
jgi:hypothetical protein